MTTAVTTLMTADEFSRMSFDVPTELVRGELVPMTNPGGRHGGISFRLAGIFYNWIQSGYDYEATTNDSGVLVERDPDTVRGPDVLVVRRDRLPNGELPVGHLSVAPDVAVEVLSPSDRWGEVLQKVSLFLKVGVAEVWVIDPDHRRVHVFRSDDEPTIYDENETLSSGVLPNFECPVRELFRGMQQGNHQ